MVDGIMQNLHRRQNVDIGQPGLIICIVSWILLVILICVLIARFSMKMAMGKKGKRFSLDDAFIILATLFSIGQTVAVSVESIHALGQHVGELSRSQIRVFQKAEYAGCMLYIANFGCARISVCLLIKNLLPGRLARYTTLGFAGFTTLWMLSGIFVTAFPCHVPRPWDFYNNKCFDLTKFINYLGATNIIVEILLIMIPLVVWNIRLDVGKRVSVSVAFISRLLIIAPVAAQLTVFNHYKSSPDFTYVYWRTVLCVQIAQNLSVITACLPCLHPFILSILSGATRTEGLVLKCKEWKLLKCFSKSNFKLDSMSSRSSTVPMKEEKDDEYCHPLATYGLDRSSAHLNSQHFNRLPSNVAKPIFTMEEPQTFFNRSIDIPRSQPATSASQKELPPPPKTLSQVGVLPIIDWETESSDQDSPRSSPARKRDSEYVFNREKVISVPVGGKLYEESEYLRKYPPPPPSPRWPRTPSTKSTKSRQK
ncbi:hypothetical protein BDV96DRAFT_22157 [Lophiotrema nucula]|uniref:Rhodopsin domain-containing protein n=1 Tax=Lophiotrema nucula TaxID=690887 RepID=A0A6A5ZFR0_9PLEO|nr:hypothetical protein BDV96DRAFT_22157 [Lophiotrema nucula]